MTEGRDQLSRLGIDAGASLWKLALLREEIGLESLPVGALAELKDRLKTWRPGRVHVTGGGASGIAAALVGIEVRVVPEFEAWGRGAPALAQRAGWTLPQRYLLVSVGTGTSILAADGGAVRRLAGSPLGGGTLMGLARLLCGAESFAEVAELAARGERRQVDLLVGDIYPEGGIALAAELTAASFAKLASRDPGDLAQSLMWLVGENLGILCTAVAHAEAIETLVFAGSALAAISALPEILRVTVEADGRKAWFLPDGAFCGALGAALSKEPAA